MSLIRRSPLVLALIAAPMAFAQDSDADRVAPAQPAQPTQQETQESPVVFRQVPPQARPQLQLPPFESMVVRGADRRIVRIDKQLDLLALRRNPLVDDETRERIRPVLREWIADLDQLVIDNLDFIERIEPPDDSKSVLLSIDLNNQATVQPVGQMMSMLIAAGPLTPHLQNRGALTREQAELNQRITSDYLQSVMNEVLLENQVRPGEELQNEQQRQHQVNTIARHVYGVSSLDAMSSYYRQLESAAPFVREIISATQLRDEARTKVEPMLEKVSNTEDRLERRKAVRKLLNELNFDERRDFLQRAKEIVPEPDLLVSQ